MLYVGELGKQQPDINGDLNKLTIQNMIDNKLILDSLQLTGKTMEDMTEMTYGRE